MNVVVDLLRRYGVVLIVVVVVVAFIVFRDRLTGSAADLSVGECFDQPAETTDISGVQRQPCNEPHDAEVFLVTDHPAPAGEIYPISLSLNRFLSEQCEPAFDTYTGLDFSAEPDLSYAAFIPTRSGWSDGDREVVCYLVRTDNAKMTTSLRAATP